MKKAKYKMFFTFCLMGVFSGCQSRVFGVEESVWNTLNEQEREKVIEGYNKRRELELVNEQKRTEQELENERHRQEVEASLAPFYVAADAIAFSLNHSKEKEVISLFLHIQQITSSCGRKLITIGDEQFEVSPFCKMSQAWVKGQRVSLRKNENDFFYPVLLKNLDNGEAVPCRKYHHSS